jgi:hypothetical protein
MFFYYFNGSYIDTFALNHDTNTLQEACKILIKTNKEYQIPDSIFNEAINRSKNDSIKCFYEGVLLSYQKNKEIHMYCNELHRQYIIYSSSSRNIYFVDFDVELGKNLLRILFVQKESLT